MNSKFTDLTDKFLKTETCGTLIEILCQYHFLRKILT